MNQLARLALVLVFALVTVTVSADELSLKKGHPSRYVVQPGDTLWDISARFLEDPWRWPEIWHANTYIDDPHLIYPGDVLILTDSGLKLLRRNNLAETKRTPSIRRSKIDDAIKTIPPEVIRPFLTQPLVLGEKEILNSGYVMVGVEDNILIGEGIEFYARGLPDLSKTLYQLFRPGIQLIHPDSGEFLGTEAVYLGDARMLRPGDVTKMLVTKSDQEIVAADRLLGVDEDKIEPYYQPHAPARDVQGQILKAHNGVSEVGPFQVVVVTMGEREGMEEGHVLRVRHKKPLHKDPVTGNMIQLPEENSGLVMVFRVFEKVSYALVMNATRAIHIGDTVVSPLR